MQFNYNSAFYKKKVRTRRLCSFEQLDELCKLNTQNLKKIGDLLFKMQQNGESLKCIDLAKSLLLKTSDIIKALNFIRSRIKR